VESTPYSDSGRATEHHVLAMADFIPPIALSYVKERIAAASDACKESKNCVIVQGSAPLLVGGR
jgi:hypothetical protein